MVKSSWSADTYFQDCRLWLKSDEMIKEPLRITALEKAFAENFTNQLRKNHFLLGRHYSHLLLAEMNYPHKTIEKKKDGSPLWQKGIKGSISHCEGKMAICISDSDSVQSVGIDIENCSRKINQSILKKISHLQELHLSNNFENCSSIKCSFYFLNFNEVPLGEILNFNRELLYTAITRAKNKASIITTADCLKVPCKKVVRRLLRLKRK